MWSVRLALKFGSKLLGRQGQMGCVVSHTCGSKSVLLCTFSEDCGIKPSLSWFFLRAGSITTGGKREVNRSKMLTVLLASEQLLTPRMTVTATMGEKCSLWASHLPRTCLPLISPEGGGGLRVCTVGPGHVAALSRVRWTQSRLSSPLPFYL